MEYTIIVLTIVVLINGWQIIKLQKRINEAEVDIMDLTDFIIEAGEKIDELDRIVNPNKDKL